MAGLLGRIETMGIYVKLYMRSLVNNSDKIVVGVVNTGFRTETPDISIPLPIASELGLYPPPTGSYGIEIEGATGRCFAYAIPRALIVRILAEDRVSRDVVANALINPFDNEVLISDALAEELGIQILYPKKGIWRFVDDPPNKIRQSISQNIDT